MGEGQGKAGVAGQSSSLYLYVAAGEWAGEDLASAWSGVSGTCSWLRVDGGKNGNAGSPVLGLQQQVATMWPVEA